MAITSFGEPALPDEVRIAEVVVDCASHEEVITFWTAALGYERGWAAGQFAQIHDPTGQQLPILFQRVPEGKIVKNRLHLDLATPDMAAEVDRLTGLGARKVRELNELGAHWTTMVDPEGNEFCVVWRRLKE